MFTDYPWSDYRWFWVARWPVLPGLPALLLIRPLGIESTGAETLRMGVMTAIMFALAVLAGRGLRGWMIGMCITLVTYGIWMALASHALFRA